MKRILILTIVSILSLNFLNAQEGQFFNFGGVSKNNYFSVITYENINEKIIVPVTINGKTRKFIFDTGASLTVSKSIFEELQSEIIDQIPVADQSGKMDTLNVISMQEIKLGDIVFNDIPAFVTDDISFFYECFGVEGFIGSNLLRNSIVRISSKESTITITDDEERLNLGKLKKYSSDMTLSPHQSNPYIWVKFQKRANESLLFDSGMSGILDLSLDNFEQMVKYDVFTDISKGFGSNSIGMHGLADDSEHYKFRVKEMVINGIKFKNITTITVNSESSRIGSRLLEYGTVILDYKNRKFYFEPFVKQEIELMAAMSPLELTVSNDKLVVGIVWDEYLKSEIEPGDVVISIDEKNYENVSICNLFTEGLNLDKREKYNLTLRKSNGNTISVVIEKK